jgi:hypothetical protein
MVIRDQKGALLIPLLLLTGIVAFTGFGIWGLMRSWSKQTEAQLLLDQCVGKKAFELKGMLETLTQSNQRMIWVRRSAVVAALLSPEALEAIQLELQIERTLQEGLRLKWRASRAMAAVKNPCSATKALPTWLPDLDWNRLPADMIGEQAFEWSTPHPEFYFLISSKSILSHRSAARVKESENGKNHWIAQWAGLR